jgi:catechol 2,3-dioxygenase-like lactoylglutathione lyase family enzyme
MDPFVSKEATMLQDGHAYAKLPASDLERARRFYVDTLGFLPTAEGPGFLRFQCGGESSFLVFSSSGRASGDHDQCGWVVDDIDAEVAELRRRGVVFEEFPGYVFEDGVRVDPAGRSAWFRDTEGNLLNLRSNFPRNGAAGRS